MLMTIAALALTAWSASMPAESDTTFAVRAPARLAVDNFAGSVTVHAWDRDAVRVRAGHSSHSDLVVKRDGQTVRVTVQHHRGIPTTVEYDLTVPAWMPLEVGGVSTEISISGTRSEIKAESVSGDVTVDGGGGFVTAGSVSGDVEVTGARGKVEATAVSGQVRIRGAGGPITASSVNGSLILEGIESNDVEATTVNGAVDYEGMINDQGAYHFGSHNGNITVAVPVRVNATVSVSTFQGDFSSDFPVSFSGTGKHGRRFSFTLGNGGANLELESFMGEIRLRRAGSNRTEVHIRSERRAKEKTSVKRGEGDDQP